MKLTGLLHSFIGILFFVTMATAQTAKKVPLDYVNPNIGGIGHLLVATDPVVQLPQGTVKLCSNPWPEIYDRYLADQQITVRLVPSSQSVMDKIKYGLGNQVNG